MHILCSAQQGQCPSSLRLSVFFLKYLTFHSLTMLLVGDIVSGVKFLRTFFNSLTHKMRLLGINEAEMCQKLPSATSM